MHMRLSDAIDATLRKEQAGFRLAVGCIDHIFTLRNIMEQCTEWNTKVHINFIDLEKAFDKHPQRHFREYPASLLMPREVCQHHQTFVQQRLVQCYSQEEVDGLVQRQ